ncbi:MAG: 3-deoxy-7-phosphoheptulonate synthase [Candidatus Sumerlaeia bacterium]|nr:3-deoxy-7-phosphoheptulonate synthase [Candidatus Sumerlaeia bacterium]
MRQTQDLRVVRAIPLTAPRDLVAELPLDDQVSDVVATGREAITRVLRGDDPRFIAVVGPCSIHDEDAALEYAGRLAELSRRVADRLLVVMRVYFEKPRTTIGWKGLINDPHMDDSFDIEEGLRRARRILLGVCRLGLPAGTEMLEPVTPQYIADLVAWASIGARTTESPTHRQMASGLSMPVGFKNTTEGDIAIAVNAMEAATHPHSFLGIDLDGMTAIIRTAGNEAVHLILRGGRTGPNYDEANVRDSIARLEQARLTSAILVDCSHANSNKDYRRQGDVWRSIVGQHAAGNVRLVGGMIESNLVEGCQKPNADRSVLKHGVSVTDGCIGWQETEDLLMWAHEQLGGLPATAAHATR